MTVSHTPDRLELIALLDFPEVKDSEFLPALILESTRANGITLADHDVVVIAQKVVSKAEGRSRKLAHVVPSAEAERIARETDKDPRIVELILQESTSIVRQAGNLIITENRLGIVMANAGIDQSNVDQGSVLLLPEDPDASARSVRDYVREQCGCEVGVVVVDSIGRAWRNGIVGHAIGVAGITALLDLRGAADRQGRTLRVTEVALADEIAAAGSLLMGQAAEGKPVVLARGFRNIRGDSTARSLLRNREFDLFR